MDFDNLGQLLRHEYETFRRRKLQENPDEPAPSQNDFAKWLGVTGYNLSNWMTGTRRPSAEYIDKLADKLGPKVYDVMGLNRKMPRDRRFHTLVEIFYDVGEKTQDRIVEVAKKLKDDNEEEANKDNRSEYALLG